MKETPDQARPKPSLWRLGLGGRPFKWILLGAILAALLVSHGFGSKWPVSPARQPAQMWSRIDYDPKLSDSFFQSNEWSYPYCGQDVVDGMWPDGDPPRLKHTALCFSTSLRLEHRVRFCEARSLGDTIELLIHDDDNPEFLDKLTIRIRNGLFACQYWTGYKIQTKSDLIWTTKRQQLTLNKQAYRKGDLIKGRIDFECVEEPTNQYYIERRGKYQAPIQIYGVFRTIVE